MLSIETFCYKVGEKKFNEKDGWFAIRHGKTMGVSPPREGTSQIHVGRTCVYRGDIKDVTKNWNPSWGENPWERYDALAKDLGF